MKPKEWLKANGHITEIGRGRMAAAHIELIKEAVANGVVIEGYESVRSTGPVEKPATIERVAVNGVKIIADIGDPTRDERSLMAYCTVDGKRIDVGMRTVCNVCGSSLTYCKCESPRVWVDHKRQAVVNFKPRPPKGV